MRSVHDADRYFSGMLINPGSNAVGNAKIVADSLALLFLIMANGCCNGTHDHIRYELFNCLQQT